MMKHLKLLVTGLLAAVLLAPCAMAASPALTDLTYEANAQRASVSLQKIDGGYALFLPSSADLTALSLLFEGGDATVTVGRQHLTIASGQSFDLTALYPEAPDDGIYALTISQGFQRLSVKVMVSKNIGSMYITSADPANKGRSYVETIKGNKASGEMTLLRADGSVIYAGELSQIKGRGNSTWEYPKKPYQIKLAKKTDLLETGDPDEAAKTWVLLANYYDQSFIRNSLTYDLASELGLAYSPNNQPVDLYYDGEYRGTYLLSEKTEIGGGRVDIHDLEGDFEDANPDVEDFDDLDTAIGTNSYGNEFQYVTGLSDPDDISGGYLLEIDYPVRAAAEKSYFTTTGGYTIVSKSPEYLSQSAMEYISSFYQEFEDAVWNGGVNPSTGKDYTEYVDLESLAKSYLILEFAQDGDAFLSSTFFYKPADEDKLYAGPVWDFDSSYGIFHHDYTITALVAGSTPIGKKLLGIPSFCEAVEEIYQNEFSALITDTALNPDPEFQTGRLCSVAGYSAEVAASQQMNDVLWAEETSDSFDTATEFLQEFLLQRDQVLSSLRWADANSTAPRFNDIPAGAWYLSAVEYVVDNGLFSGITKNLFDPHGTMTRGMAVTVLHNLAGMPDAAEDLSFGDVSEDQWYTEAVIWAAENGITTGYSKGVFRPDKKLTTQELVAFLHNYARSIGCDMTVSEIPNDFPDSVADWAADAYAWAMDRGIFAGISPDEFSPAGDIPRCVAAAMLERFDSVITAEPDVQ